MREFILNEMSKEYRGTIFMTSKRYNNIDVLKGLGIILVLMTHTNAALVWERVYTAFYMPLFFWASGYLYQYTGGGYLKKKIKTIIFPYIIAAVGYVLLDLFRCGFSFVLMKRLLHGTFFYPTTDAMSRWGAPLWFLPCLFLVEMSFWILQATIEKKYHSTIIIAITGLGFILADHFSGQSNRLPWCMDTATMAIGIYYFGYLCQNIDLQSLSLRIKNFPFVISFLFLIHFCRMNSISMWANRYGDKFLFIFNAAGGIIIINIMILKIMRCKNTLIIKCIDFFRWIGKYSIYIYMIHSAAIWWWTNTICIHIANARLKNSILFAATLVTSILFLLLVIKIKKCKNRI